MANNQINRLLEFANMQMAAEAFLLRQGESSIGQLTQQQLFDRLVEGNTHASKFMPMQAEVFTNPTTGYQVLAQYRNDPKLAEGAGFSGTLFRNRETGELTLSFRSTEFIDDAVRDNKATNLLEIKNLGWAFGQISEMETWYAQLRADPNLLGGKTFNVTGYSLGGHLATAFSILRREAFDATGDPDANPIINTYTFNGAGTGAILNGRRLTDLVADFNRIRSNYAASPEWTSLSLVAQNTVKAQAQSRVDEINAEQIRVSNLSGVTRAFDTSAPAGASSLLAYQVAAVLVGQDTAGASNFPLPGGTNWLPTSPRFVAPAMQINNMTEIVGMESGGLSPSFVSNSGLHYGVRVDTYIEDQPLMRGVFTASVVGGILKLQGLNFLVNNPGQNDFADTHSLVLLVDSLSLMAAMETLAPDITVETAGKILAAMSNVAADTAIGTQGNAEGDSLERMLDALRNLVLGPGQEPTLDYNETLEGNTWHLDDLREPFQDNLAELNSVIDDLIDENVFEIESLADIDADQLTTLASGPDAFAYRYALVELNPFAVDGDSVYETLYEAHNTTGKLDLYDVTGGSSALTDEWIADRAQLLAWKAFRNTKNIDDTSTLHRQDGVNESQFYTDVDSDTLILVQGSPLDVRTAYITFGSEQDDSGVGTLIGGGFDDRLYGGSGNDTLQGGRGNDYLEGGSGNDTYVWNTGDGFDTILDTDGVGKLVINEQTVSGVIQIAGNVYINADKTLLLHFEGSPTTGGVLIVNGDLEIENFTNGDLGIVLGGVGSLDQLQPTTTAFRRPFSANTPAVGFGTNGADSLVETDAFFVAKGGNDFLKVSEAGYAEFYGGPGEDVIIGGGISPDGYDNGLIGEAGSDIILGGENNETIYGDFGGLVYGRDDFRLPTFYFFGGFTFGDSDGTGYWHWTRDFLEVDVSDTPLEPFRGTYAEAFRYVLGIADDTDLSTLYDDYIEGGGGNDRISGGNGSDVIFGGSGDDFLVGDGFGLIPQGFFPMPQWLVDAMPLLGTPGDDYIDGGSGNDMLGDDPTRVGLDSMGGNDVLIGGDGNDFLNNVDPTSEIASYSNYLEGGEDDDILHSSNYSIDGIDTLVGGPGNDTLAVSTRGNADMDGGPGNDTLTMDMLGNAIMDGGTGSDSYTASFIDPAVLSSILPGLLPGGVVIRDYDETGSDFDTFSMSMFAFGEFPLFITRDESNLYFGVPGYRHWLTVENWFNGTESKIETISISFTDFNDIEHQAPQFYDIAAIENRFITATADADFLWASDEGGPLAGGLGDDTMFGGDGNDTLTGGEGNDTQDGGRGSDVYVFGIGDGVDRIRDTGSFGTDGISFGSGITPQMLTLSPDSQSIQIGDNGDAIRFDDPDSADVPQSSSIEYLQFSDGVTLTFQQFLDGNLDPISTETDESTGGIGVGGDSGGSAGSDIPNAGAGGELPNGGTGGGDHAEVFAGADTDGFVPGIEPADNGASRESDALALDFQADLFSILRQLEQRYQIGKAEFSGGTGWSEQSIHSDLQRDSWFEPWNDSLVHGYFQGRDDDQFASSRKPEENRDDRKLQRGRDQIADLLESYFAHEPRNDFESLEEESERGERREAVLTPWEIAMRWKRVGRYMDGLSDDRDQDARQGAGEIRSFDISSFLGGGGGTAFGHAGSTGATRGMGNLKTLSGLEEGFARLEPGSLM